MQIRCSKKGCKQHEKCLKTEPKWEPKSRKHQSKTRSENRCEKGDTCKMCRRHVAGAFLRLNHLFSSRPRLVFVSFSSSRLRLVSSSPECSFSVQTSNFSSHLRHFKRRSASCNVTWRLVTSVLVPSSSSQKRKRLQGNADRSIAKATDATHSLG